MKTRWTRLISVLCLVALLIGMLPVVAVAAPNDPIVWCIEDGDTTASGFFKFADYKEKRSESDNKLQNVAFNGKTYSGGALEVRHSGSNLATSKISFTAETSGKLTMVCLNRASTVTQGGIELDGTVVAQGARDTWITFESDTLEAGEHTLQPYGQHKEFWIVGMIWTPDAADAGDDEPTPVSGKVELDKDTVDLTAGTSETVVATAAKQVYAVAADAAVTTAVKDNGKGTYTVTLDTEVKEAKTVKVYVVTGDTEITTLEAAKAAYDAKNGAVLTVNIQTVLDKTALDAAITAAEEEIKVPEVSKDGSGLNPANNWVTEAEKQAFQDAIDAAKRALTEAATQEAIDTAVKTLEAAQKTFQDAYKPGTDKDAKTIYTIAKDVTPAEGGTVTVEPEKAQVGDKVTVTIEPAKGYEVKEYAATYKVGEDAKTIELTEGETEGTYTFTMPDAAVTVTVTFEETKVVLDKKDLEDAIKNAKTYVVSEDAVVKDGTKAEDVEKGKTVYPEAAVKAFNDAIAAAEKVLDEATTQDEIEKAVTALNQALTTFQAAKIVGTKEEAVEPTDDTYAIIVDADATKGTVTVAETAKAGDTVTVTVEAKTGFEVDAVTVKTASGKDVTVTEANGKYTFKMPTEAVTVTVTFKATTTPETVDKTALEKAVKDAQAKVAGVKTSVDGKDIAQGEKWATAAELKDINDAIAAAQAVLDNKDATQAQVNSALETLNAAIAAFTPKDGSKTEEQPGEVDKTALDEAIKKATGLYNATQVSEAGDGSDINPAQKWVTDEQYTDFLTDILAAQLVQADPDATQAEVDAAVEALNAAIAAFEAARKDGLNKDAPILAEDIVVDPESLELKVGGSAKLTATVSPDNVTDKTVYWNTEDTSLISLNKTTTQSGESITVTAKAVGTATITVMAGQKYTEVTVTITKATTPSGGGGVSSGSGSNSASTSTSKTNPFGGKVTIVTTAAGGKTLTVTDKNGEVVAKVVIPAQTPDLGYKFTDVPDGHWAEPSIQAMAAMKIFQGVSTTGHIFDMNSAVTRGTMAQILFNLSQGKSGINNPFTDAQGAWYSDAVAWAAMVGVVTGVSDTNFAPNDSITREQLITMLYRFAQLLALDTNVTADMGKFVDANAISSWASEAMTWAVGKGLIIGKGAGNLDPTAAASRAEAAVIIDRFLQMV